MISAIGREPGNGDDDRERECEDGVGDGPGSVDADPRGAAAMGTDDPAEAGTEAGGGSGGPVQSRTLAATRHDAAAMPLTGPLIRSRVRAGLLPPKPA